PIEKPPMLLGLTEHRPVARLALPKRLLGQVALGDVPVDPLEADRPPLTIAHHPCPSLERDHATVLAERTDLEERGEFLAGERAPGAIRHALAIGGRAARPPVPVPQVARGPARQAPVRRCVA